ncbi:hypothetical protein PFISCL1PPCAC_1238, partial [Pristionchus fissidentatus]
LSFFSIAAAFPHELDPFPIPDPTSAEGCGLRSKVCIKSEECTSGICSVTPGETTGCCQDDPLVDNVDAPLINPFGSDPPLIILETTTTPTGRDFEEICPFSVPLCVWDQDCGAGGFCNHATSTNTEYYGCCQYTPIEYYPIEDEGGVTSEPPACRFGITTCITDFECDSGDYCDHKASRSEILGCCHSGSAPSAASAAPFPLPDLFPTPAPFRPAPARAVKRKQRHKERRCKTQCLVDSDCAKMEGSCGYVEGSGLGCCKPNFF